MRFRTQELFDLGSGIRNKHSGSATLGRRVSSTYQKSIPRTAAGQRVHVDWFRGPHSQMLTETSAQGGVNTIFTKLSAL
jgi:hypothetical protein